MLVSNIGIPEPSAVTVDFSADQSCGGGKVSPPPKLRAFHL